MGGPFFPGRSVYGVAYDGREGRHRIWAAPASMHWGAQLCSSDDFGKRWDRPKTPRIRFPEPAGASLANIWQISSGPPQEPDTLYCGVQPAALFESRDAGKTWAFNEGLWNHPHRSKWMPDGGDSWRDIARGVPSDFGFCMAMHPADPDTVFILPIESDEFRCVPEGKLRVYRTRDAGRSWKPMTRGLPQKNAFETVLRDAMARTASTPPASISGRAAGSSSPRATRAAPGIFCTKACRPWSP